MRLVERLGLGSLEKLGEMSFIEYSLWKAETILSAGELEASAPELPDTPPRMPPDGVLLRDG